MQKHGAQAELRFGSSKPAQATNWRNWWLKHVLAAMTSGFSPPIHHHSSPFSTHLGSSWIILAPGLCKSQLQIRIFQLLQLLLQGFQRVLGPQLDHSRWSWLTNDRNVLKSPPKKKKNIPNIGPNISNMQEYAGYFGYLGN